MILGANFGEFHELVSLSEQSLTVTMTGRIEDEQSSVVSTRLSDIVLWNGVIGVRPVLRRM